MILSEWLKRNGIKRNDFAARIGVSASDITNMCSGVQWLSRRTALAIVRETKGEVTANDFMNLSQPECSDADAA